MSFTARPPFASGMQNSGQNQQAQQGQSNASNAAAPGAIPNLSMINNPATTNTVPTSNYSSSPASNSSVMFEHQKLMQQQLLVQTQLLLQQQQQQQKQPNAQTQQATFPHQANPQQALNRLVNEIQKNGGSSLAQQQQLQQFVQMSALGMLTQAAQQGLLQQQKSFQQQQSVVPLPSNTTITPVGRQNVPATQKQSTNHHPRSNAVNKNLPQSMSVPAQSRNKTASMTAKPSVATIPPPFNNPSLNISTVAPKPYAARQAAANITPSLTITKTISHSPSSSSSQLAKSAGGLVNRPPIGSNVANTANIPSLQKPTLIPETISMSLANALAVKTPTHAPSISLTPALKLSASPTIKSTPMTPQKSNVPQAVTAANVQKLSPTSPRLKQTPRKNMNPIKTSVSPPGALPPTSVQSAVPRTDPKTDPKPDSSAALISTVISAVKPVTTNNVTVAKALTISSPSKNITQAKQESVKPVVSSPGKIERAKKASVTVASEPKIDRILNAATLKESEPAPNGSIPPKVQNIPKTNAAAETSIKAHVMAESEKKSANNDKNKSVKAISDATEDKSAKEETAPKRETSKVSDQPSETKPKAEKEIAKSASKNKAPSTPVNTKTSVAKANVVSTSKPVQSLIEVRAKRNRLKTIPYQSPTPEIELVSKISAIEANNLNRNPEEKLTLFYRNEFLAVRNADGGFFLCQTINNVYKTSPKIRIRWLSEEPTNQHIYCLDFYDSTDLECVLTSVSLTKMSKGKFQLTKTERERIENILKRALDVEKGIVTRPEVTEENPDGLDFSLYTDESQIEKKTPAKRKSNDKTRSVQRPATSASKRKSTNQVSDETPQKRAKQSTKKSISSKTLAPNKSPSESAKKMSNSKSDKAKDITVESTPTSKRTATKRKLIDEEKTDDANTKKDEDELSKDTETQTNKEKEYTPKEVAEKFSFLVGLKSQAAPPEWLQAPDRHFRCE